MRSKTAFDRRESIGWGWHNGFTNTYTVYLSQECLCFGEGLYGCICGWVSPTPPLGKGTVFSKLKTRLAGGDGLACARRGWTQAGRPDKLR